MNKICINNLEFEYSPSFSIRWKQEIDNFGYFKVLSEINWPTLSITEWPHYFNHDLNIVFSEPSVRLFDPYTNQVAFLKWRSMSWGFFVCKFSEDFIIANIPSDWLSSSFLRIHKANRIKFINYLVMKEDSDSNYFNKYNSEDFSEGNWELTVSMDHLQSWYISKNLMSYLQEYKNHELISEIFKAKRIFSTASSFQEICRLEQLKPHPDICIYYSLQNYSQDYHFLSKVGLIDNIDWLNIRFEWISINSTLNAEEWEFICDLLRLSKTKYEIEEIMVWTKNLSDCLTLLSLCSLCPNLSTVILQYTIEDIDDSANRIKDSSKEFFKMHGFITIFSVQSKRKY